MTHAERRAVAGADPLHGAELIHRRHYFASVRAGGGVGLAISSSGCRGTIRPSGNATNVTGTVRLFGNWNDDVFTSIRDHLSRLPGVRIKDATTERMRQAGARGGWLRRRQRAEQGHRAGRATLAHALEESIEGGRHAGTPPASSSSIVRTEISTFSVVCTSSTLAAIRSSAAST